MAKIGIFSHGPSDSINLLKPALEETFSGNVRKIRRENSRFVGRSGDVVFNYGASSMPMSVVGEATLLNNPSAIAAASNKLDAFNAMRTAGVRTVDFTSSREEAQGWVDGGTLVYARTRLQGHSGEGIEIAYNNPPAVGDAGGYPVRDTLPSARLYTKAVMGNRREYRIHVFKGKIIYIQQKRRRDGALQMEGYSNLVRNHASGWIYATQSATPINNAAKREAIKAVAALGLDFGAVDVITNREDAFVLEVNTAPGMTGTTLDVYRDAILAVANNTEITGEEVDLSEAADDENFALQGDNTRANTNARRTQPQPAAAQRTEEPAAPQAAPVSTPVAAPQQARTRSSSLTNDAFYWVTVNGEETIGQFKQNQNCFFVVGWEVPIDREDATNVSLVGR